MSMYTFAFLCAVGLLALQVPSIIAGTSSADQDEIVNKHNALRRDVQPTASNMLKMSWNSQAAANAQKWADTCAMDHSPEGDRTISTGECGENIFMATNKATWDTAVQDWYDEVKNFRYGVGAVNGKTVGHLTQVVWAMSYEVGCGMAHCPSHNLPYYYVCQYCPAGNYDVRHPYKAGPSCGDCPNDCDDKLCTNPCPYTDKYANCPALAETVGCEHKLIAPVCKASCQCKNKIH